MLGEEEEADCRHPIIGGEDHPVIIKVIHKDKDPDHILRDPHRTLQLYKGEEKH